ncbi:MAG: hypothetical protein OXT06_18735 [Rhodospirillaceae bacterium]|nr:hypothetical protein [Rhodospirillaceae bacterium]
MIGFDTSAESINGGAGTDKIQLFGASQSVNGTNLVNVESIEAIDLGGVGSNTLSVNSALITTVSGSGTLSVFGNGDDVVESSSNWNLDGPVTFGSTVFDRFADGGSTIDSTVTTFRSTGDVNFNAGASLTHNLVNLGTLSTSDGTYTNNGSVTLTATGDIDMTGSKVLAGSGTFVNQQSLNLQDDTIAGILDGGTGTIGLEGTVTIDGKLIIGAATTVEGTITPLVQGSGTLVNQGSQSIDDGSTLTVATLRNEGTLDFQTLTSTITSSRIENAAGATVDFFVDTTIDMAPGNTLSNAGLAQVSSANLTFQDGLIANSGTINVTAASSTLSVSNGEVSMAAGGDIVGAGQLKLTNSDFNVGTGVSFTFGSGGTGPTLDVITGNITGGGTLVNESEIAADGAGTISVSNFVNSNGGTLNHADGALVVTSAFDNQANSELVVNKSVTNTDISFSNDFTNSGLVRFEGANLGSITVGGGSGTLSNAGSGTIQVLEGDNSLNTNLVNAAGGILDISATVTGLTRLTNTSAFSNQGLVRLQSGTLGTETALLDQGAGNTLTNTGTISLEGGVAGGIVELTSDLDNQGLVTVTSSAEARINGASGATGSLDNSGTISIAAGKQLKAGLDTGQSGSLNFTNSGSIDVSGKFTLQQTTLTHTGTLTTVSGAEFSVIENSVLNLTADVLNVAGSTLTVGNGTATGEVGGSGTLFNASVLALNNGTLSGNTNDSSGAISFQGNANLNTGALEFGQDTNFNFAASTDKFANSGTIDVNGNSTLTVVTGTLENLAAGTINVFGAGTIALASGGIFSDSGTTNFGASPGSLTIDGNMIRGDSASMLFELGGLAPGIHDGFDQLTVTGELTAGGTLDVVEFGTFDVSVGDNFDIVNAGTLTGSFREISGLEVGGGVVLDAVQSGTGITLTGRAVTHQGTADGDTLSGGTGADVIVGEGGDDTIAGGGGADLLHGGAGDDLFIASDAGFGRLDGGAGTDTVRLAGGDLDLTGLRGDQLSGIEHFDLTGGGNNTLTLDGDIVFDATGGTNPLTGTLDSLLIDGDAGDAVAVDNTFTNTGSVTIGANGYSVFESADSGAKIFVDGDVAVTVI